MKNHVYLLRSSLINRNILRKNNEENHQYKNKSKFLAILKNKENRL